MVRTRGFKLFRTNVRIDTKRFVDRVHRQIVAGYMCVAPVLERSCEQYFEFIQACKRRTIAHLLGGVENTL